MATPSVSNITLGDQVRVRNLGVEPIDLQWNLRKYTIEPGSDGYIPFDLAKMAFGDPRSSDIVQAVTDEFNGTMFISDRPTEVRRLQQLYPDSHPKFREYIPGDRSYLRDGISDRCPQVEVYTLAGDRIYTVIDDPMGDRIIAAAPTRRDQDFQATQLQAQSEQLIKQARIIKILSEKAGIDLDEIAPEEEPEPAVSAEAPTVSTVRENPAMAFNPRTKKITAKKPAQSDPTTLEGLPEDD
jgi:hypothetical protein